MRRAPLNLLLRIGMALWLIGSFVPRHIWCVIQYWRLRYQLRRVPDVHALLPDIKTLLRADYRWGYLRIQLRRENAFFRLLRWSENAGPLHLVYNGAGFLVNWNVVRIRFWILHMAHRDRQHIRVVASRLRRQRAVWRARHPVVLFRDELSRDIGISLVSAPPARPYPSCSV